VAGILDLDPQTQGLLAAAFAGLQASGPSRMPTSFGQVVGQAGTAGLQATDQAAQLQARLRLQKLQADQLQQQLDMQKDVLSISGGDASKLMTDPDTMERIGILGALRGHAGYAGLIGQAEKIRARKVAESELGTMRSRGAIEPDQQEVQQAADQGTPAPSAAPQGGAFSALFSSPYVGEQAKALQAQLNASPALAADPEAWRRHYDRLQAAHLAGLAQERSLQDRQAGREESLALRREIPEIVAGARNPQIIQSDQGIFTLHNGQLQPVLGPSGGILRPTATARIDMSTANQLQRQFNAATRPAIDALGSTAVYRNARESGDTAQAATIAAEALRRSARGGNQRFSADVGRLLGSGYGSGSIADRLENFISNELKGAPSNETLRKLDNLIGATEQANLEQIARWNRHYSGQAKAHGIPVQNVIGAPTVEGNTVVFPEGDMVRFKTTAEAQAKAQQWQDAH